MHMKRKKLWFGFVSREALVSREGTIVI